MGTAEKHRIIKELGLGRSFKAHLIQPSCHEQEHLQLAQVAQGHVPSDLHTGSMQGGGDGDPLTLQRGGDQNPGVAQTEQT